MYGYHENLYARLCSICGWIAPPREEWEGGAPCTHCPSCGSALERLACQACDAPLMYQQVMSMTPQGGVPLVLVAPHCSHCGADSTRREPRMAKKKGPPASAADLEDRLSRKMRGKPPTDPRP